ncbi:hypothetical protein D3093_35455 (plasmid) [Azospirillum argentinense]|uniref:Uncharacterized protein n=1 Tax=Azospirillum argentinense TaxID=2970906 RepID=A0A4D8Q2R2_9PROT|nr:hypothetical protein [Azospirillum argentinense]QCO00542.1 hypothetical protein D3093_35455 [Azospirillum argentinense]
MPAPFSFYVESRSGQVVTAALITEPLPSLDGIRTVWDEWEDSDHEPQLDEFIGNVLLTYADDSRRIVDLADLSAGFLPGGCGHGRVWTPEFRCPDGTLCFIATQRWMCCSEEAAILLGTRWHSVPGDSFMLYPCGPQPTGKAVELDWSEDGGMTVVGSDKPAQAGTWKTSLGSGLRLGIVALPAAAPLEPVEG